MPASNRREFLKASTAITAATIVPRHVLGGPGTTAPSDMVNVALVGAGGRGLQNARELLALNDVQITAIADPAKHWDLSNFFYKGVAGSEPATAEFEKHYSATKSGYKVQNFVDYREMLANASSEFDAILCATPDHLHAHISVLAMRAGKHVYCEKPLTHNIAEARLVAKVAKETGMSTQLGNQGHSQDTQRETVEWIRSGVLGSIKEVHAWVPATRWNQMLKQPPTQTQSLPKGLNWDLWCGPRNPVGFHEAYAPVAWRDFWQFGLGAMGDFGCHDLDSAMWSLELGMPSRVEMLPAGQTHPDMIPYGEAGHFHFDATDSHEELQIHWYSGGLKPSHPDPIPEDQPLPYRGVMFVGEKGVMVCQGAGGKATVFPESLASASPPPTPTIARSPGHHREWIDAIKGGPAAMSEFGYGAKLTELTLLGVLAMRLGKQIHWDAENMAVIGNDKAHEIIHGTYRDGWKLDA
ncbi:Glucose--fructose oxidoreductase precursor [Rubripirellula amarantea]|uniref:Glucose--fructose oxidoreductase n=1 Tax=Rubripirellula amarantea TaxID=2527999 RepID=A0A5C5WQW5_9BACT|nr:Gfo/Idh/MocA family oxidoreductase [Rubripirellula amarantea]TWT52850.1 Glucose--fructose oxidoreductase precursor [Rubripirellula amarantea]